MNKSIAIAAAVATVAAIMSAPTVQAEWKIGEDSLGYLNMFQHDTTAGTSIAIGYDGSENCTDFRLLFTNYFPATPPYTVMGISSTAPVVTVNGTDYNFSETVPYRSTYDEMIAFTYLYVPTEQFLVSMIEDDGTIEWDDGTLQNRANYSNANFAQTLNQVVTRCVEVFSAQEEPPEGVEVL